MVVQSVSTLLAQCTEKVRENVFQISFLFSLRQRTEPDTETSHTDTAIRSIMALASKGTETIHNLSLLCVLGLYGSHPDMKQTAES